MQRSPIAFVLIVPAAVIVLAVVGLFIGTDVSVPGYAMAMLDDQHHTFLTLPCLDEWQHRPSDGSVLRRSTVAEADRLHYDVDRGCIDDGGYRDDGWPLSLTILQSLHLWWPYQHWWDRPYDTPEGTVYPKPDQG